MRWGYRDALTFAAWRFQGTSEGGTITATVVDAHEFHLTQLPLTVAVDVGRAPWRWPVSDVQVSGAMVTISVGPLERT